MRGFLVFYSSLTILLTATLISCGKGQQTSPPAQAPSPQKVAPGTPKHNQPPQVQPDNYFFFTDIRDLAKYKKNPVAIALLKSFSKSTQSFFGDGTSFDEKGVDKNQTSRMHSVFGVEILEMNRGDSDEPYEILVGALYTDKNSAPKFRTWWVDLDSNLKMTRVVVADDIPASQLNLDVHVGLLQRKLVMQLDGGFKIIYPLGVGGFDNGGDKNSPNRVLTPVLTQAYIPPRAIIDSRTDPSYYLGEPFIRIFDGKKQFTPIGFHIQQFGSSGLKRSFVSHGCMHLREKDLYEFYTLLKSSNAQYVPLEIKLNIDDLEDHPFPLLNTAYKVISYKKDPSGLMLASSTEQPPLLDLKWVRGTTPLNHVYGDTSWIDQP